MNPMLSYWRIAETPKFERAIAVEVVENPGTTFDRAYIAAQLPIATTDMLIYRRAPVAGEWTGTLPADAVVEVYVINDWTTVRTLQDTYGERLREPEIDSWINQQLTAAA